MKVMSTVIHEQVKKTLVGVLKTRNVMQQGGEVLQLLRCVSRGGWVVNMGECWFYVIVQWPLSTCQALIVNDESPIVQSIL